MAKLDYYKEKADKMKIVFRFILNSILALSIGMAGLVYNIIVGKLRSEYFLYTAIPLLIFIVISAIMGIIVWNKTNKFDKEIKKLKGTEC